MRTYSKRMGKIMRMRAIKTAGGQDATVYRDFNFDSEISNLDTKKSIISDAPEHFSHYTTLLSSTREWISINEERGELNRTDYEVNAESDRLFNLKGGDLRKPKNYGDR